MNIENLCIGCFAQLEPGSIYCPVCGYDQKSKATQLYQLPPRTILSGKYMIGKVLGEGGFGITYVGYDLNLDLKVAVKEYYPSGFVTRSSTVSTTVQPHVGEQGDIFINGRDRFVDEAKRLAKFRVFPGIVMVNDFFVENSTAYIVMEFIDGQTLKSYIAQMGGRIMPEHVFELLGPVFSSLAQIHESGIIHRDISPDNLMITSDGSVKLLDFGAAREFGEDGNKSLSVLLKHGYAPMEQYASRGVQGPHTDVYALSATVYKALTGITPESSMDRVIEDRVEPPSSLGIALPPHQEAALMKGLAVRQQDRYQTIRELYVELGLNIIQPSARIQVSQVNDQEQTPAAPDLDDLHKTPAAPDLDDPQIPPVAPDLDDPQIPLAIYPKQSKTIAAIVVACIVIAIAFALTTLLPNAPNQGDADITAANGIEDIGTITVAQPSPTDNNIETNTDDDPAIDVNDILSMIMQDISGDISGNFLAIEQHPDHIQLRFESDALFHPTGYLKQDEATNAIRDISKILVQYSGLVIFIEAHTDNVPPSRPVAHSNYNYSFHLAAEIEGVLVSMFEDYYQENIDIPIRIIAKGIGENEPIATNDTSDGRASNRRIYIKIFHGDVEIPEPVLNYNVVIVGWDERDGQFDVADWQDIIAVAGGRFHTVGLKPDGTVVAIGLEYYGQLDVSDWRDIVAVAAGAFHTVGLKSDGTVVAVGDNNRGQLDVSDWQDITMVVAGGGNTVGLRSDGTVVAVGGNDSGQLEVSEWRDIVAIASGPYEHTVGLKSDGTVLVAGYVYAIDDVSDWQDIVAVDAGIAFTVGLRSDGTIIATLSDVVESCYSEWRDIVSVVAGSRYIVGLKSDGTVVTALPDHMEHDSHHFDTSAWRNIVAIASGEGSIIGITAN
ncbi:MAG: protein kinase [Oscillospiraceae bacterium]|jgi:serine/threonine protein kinase|nr:protein kinase [Oscillospiraceae bacterium]